MSGELARAPGSALRTVADALRSGASPDQAWRRVGVIVHDGLPTGSSLRAALGDDGATAAVLAAARLAHELGASAAPVLDSVLCSMEEEADAAVRRDTALAGPRASARVLAWLPVLGLALGIVLGVNPLGVLLDPRGGWLLLTCGAGASLLGRWWSWRLVRSAVAAGAGEDQGRSAISRRRPARGAEGSAAVHRAGYPRGRRLSAFREQAPGTMSTTPVTVVLDLVAAACESGASVPGTLTAVGLAVGGCRGAALADVASLLVDGVAWGRAWSAREAPLGPVAEALRPAWEDGASPVAAARAAARALRRERQARALAAAERLGVQLLLPLALCHLPAFVLLGIVPVLVSFVGQSTAG